jgi:hypothetical protein
MAYSALSNSLNTSLRRIATKASVFYLIQNIQLIASQSGQQAGRKRAGKEVKAKK